MANEKVWLVTRVPAEVKAKVDAEAVRLEQTTNDIVVAALERHIDHIHTNSGAGEARQTGFMLHAPSDLADKAMAATAGDPQAAAFWLLERMRRGVRLETGADAMIDGMAATPNLRRCLGWRPVRRQAPQQAPPAKPPVTNQTRHGPPGRRTRHMSQGRGGAGFAGGSVYRLYEPVCRRKWQCSF